jgi:hypothetical protein
MSVLAPWHRHVAPSRFGRRRGAQEILALAVRIVREMDELNVLSTSVLPNLFRQSAMFAVEAHESHLS